MTMSERLSQETLRNCVVTALCESLVRVCGGGLHLEGGEEEREEESWTAEVESVARSTVSFPNKKPAPLDGKPHDVEIRAALTLFHRCAGRKRKHPGDKTASMRQLSAVSDLGVRRIIESPHALAELLCHALEEPMKQEHLSYDVRSSSSGIICLVTPKRAQALRESGRFPCPKCVKWCKGEKGLWWHQQRKHGSEHSVAVAAASSEQTVLALVPYEPNHALVQQAANPEVPMSSGCHIERDEVFELVKNGQLDALTQAIEDGYDPRKICDRNGASLLLWAAGSGQLSIVRYLIETCGCSPDLPQRGKRSFSGRTALHWASRNGQLEVVRYLVGKCGVNIDASTADGTTALCWSSWQGHLPVMRFLHESGADVEKSNSFGCNAVLWCAQGNGTLEVMKWLQSIGLSLMLTNSNGHGALHKAAQRRRGDLCEWLCTFVYEKLTSDAACVNWFDIIGPDNDGCCPSDLAGMEGDESLAVCIAKHEKLLAQLWYTQLVEREASERDLERVDNRLRELLPSWLHLEAGLMIHASEEDLNVWEPWGGVRRMQSILRRIHGCQASQSNCR